MMARLDGRRITALVAMVALLPNVTGCYESLAVRTAVVPVGTQVSLAITDRGRVALGPQMGEGVVRLNGTVADASDSVYVVKISSVDYLAAPTGHWTGEEIKVPRDYIASVEERRLSRKRSWLMAGLAVGAIVVLSLGIKIIGGGSVPDGRIPENPPGTS
jgi:hypothetical protein